MFSTNVLKFGWFDICSWLVTHQASQVGSVIHPFVSELQWLLYFKKLSFLKNKKKNISQILRLVHTIRRLDQEKNSVHFLLSISIIKKKKKILLSSIYYILITSIKKEY